MKFGKKNCNMASIQTMELDDRETGIFFANGRIHDKEDGDGRILTGFFLRHPPVAGIILAFKC